MKKILLAMLLVFVTLPLSARKRNIPHNYPSQPMAVHHPQHTEEGYIHVATPEQVREIVAYVKGITFDDDKVKAIVLCMNLRPLYSQDLSKLIRFITFSDAKKNVMKKTYRLCPDKEYFHLLVEEHLTFSADKEDIYKFIHEVELAEKTQRPRR